MPRKHTHKTEMRSVLGPTLTTNQKRREWKKGRIQHSRPIEAAMHEFENE